MGVVYNRAESAAFQAALSGNLDVWVAGVVVWRNGITHLAGLVDAGQLAGSAYQAAKTLFVDRLGPVVESGSSACVWARIHLGEYAAAEAPLLDDEHVDEALLQIAVTELEAAIHEITHWGIVWLPWHEDDQAVSVLKEQLEATQTKLDEVRAFDQQVSGLFNDELALAQTIATAVSSITGGSMSADGTYVPAIGDDESWITATRDYVNNHAYDPDTQFGNGDPYGGNQGSLFYQWGSMSDRERQAIEDIIHGYYHGLNDTDIRRMLNQMNATGCGYVAGVNSIVAHFADDPEAFEGAFGYSLYAPDGSVNYDRLFADYWCYVQSRNPLVDPTGEGWFDPVGIFPAGGDHLHDYLASHGIEVTTKTVERATMAEYDWVKDSGGHIQVSANPLLLYNMDGTWEQGGGGHAMTVTGDGADADGRRFLVVSSWGDQYKIYPDEYGGPLYDTDNDGAKDDWVLVSYLQLSVVTYE